MKQRTSYIAAAILTVAAMLVVWKTFAPQPGTPVKAVHDHDAGHDEEGETGRVEMSDAKASAARLGLERAGPAKLQRSLVLSGTVGANEEAMSLIVPRFPGVVRQIRKRLGERVERGEAIATVESNQSLTFYELKSPIAGAVIERRVTPGEAVNDQRPLFVVADLSSVWADFTVHRQDFASLKLGQAVTIDPGAGLPGIETSIAYLSPYGAPDTQTMLARAVVDNSALTLRPGLFVSGAVLLDEVAAAVAVKLEALQTVEDRPVVFVRDGDGFVARPVEIGRRDERMAEILSGIEAGETYVAANSFVLKSELGKGAADHAH